MSDNLSKRVKEAMIKDEICHREPEFTKLLSDVRKKLLEIVYADDSYTTIVFTGSGTAAMESVISSVPKEGHLAILNNGVYSDRLVKIARSYGMGITEISIGNNYPNLKELEKILADKKITHFAMVHHETVTGMLNPLTEIGELCKRFDKKLVVDVISTIATEDIDVRRDNISFLMASSNKGTQGPEGLSFVIAKKEELKKMKNTMRNYYLNLYMNYESQEMAGQCLFTPAVRIFSGLNEALDELKDEGLNNRISRYKELAKTMRAGIKKLGFVIMIKQEHRSNTVTVVYLPENMNYEELHSKLKKKGFVIYGGKSFNNKQTFRLCTFGDIYQEDILRFLKAFEEVFRDYK